MGALRFAIIAVGDELLAGRTVDTNSAWLSAELDRLGFETVERITVGDEIGAIGEAIARARSRAGACIMCGGLGPTVDDRTTEAVADYFGRGLCTEPRALAEVLEKYARRGLVPPGGETPKEAMLPEGAEPLGNSVGIAPGFLVEEAGFTLFALPGVPHEMRDIFEKGIAPRIARFAPVDRPKSLSLYTTGIAESRLAGRIDPILTDFPNEKIAFYPSFYGVELRLSGNARSAAFEEFSRRVTETAAPWCYSTDERSLPIVAGERLAEIGAKLSTAESCTGGLLASRLVEVAGASAWFSGGVVAYSNRAKAELLGVDISSLERFGAVSAEVAGQMARGAAEKFHSEFALSTTGIAGPSGATPEKPVGLVFYALFSPEGITVRSNIFAGGREAHRHRSSQSALAMLWLALEGRLNRHEWLDGSRSAKWGGL